MSEDDFELSGEAASAKKQHKVKLPPKDSSEYRKLENCLDFRRNSTQISRSNLIEVLVFTVDSFSEPHLTLAKEMMGDVEQGKLSRTRHYQLASMLKRYLDQVSDHMRGAAEAAIEQAMQIEALCKIKVIESSGSNYKGNVKWVDKLPDFVT